MDYIKYHIEYDEVLLSIDTTTGKWRQVQGEGTGNVDTMTVSEYTTFWDNLEVTASGYQPPTP